MTKLIKSMPSKPIKNLWMSREDYGKPRDNLDNWYFQSCYEGEATIMVYKDWNSDRYDLVLDKVQKFWMKMVFCLDRKKDPYDYGFIKIAK